MVAGTTEGARATGAGRCGTQAGYRRSRSAKQRKPAFQGGAGAGSERLLSMGGAGRRLGAPAFQGGVGRRLGAPAFQGGVGRRLERLLSIGAGRQSPKALCKAKKGCFPGGSADAVGGGEEALVAAHASVGEESEDEGEDEESDAAEEDGSGVVVGSG